MRKLATIRRVLELSPIEGADLIEVALVDGWRTVVKKGEFQVGDLAVYFEIDSWIPKAVAPFLFKGKVYNGVEGARLQTVRLRGQISQGLLLTLSILPEPLEQFGVYGPCSDAEGIDVTVALGVQLWEPPPPKQQSFNPGRPAGNFPPFLRKTDQERVQNLRGDLARWQGGFWEESEKLDGTSFTAFVHEGRQGVCSRNFEIKEDDDGAPGLYWKMARETGIFDHIAEGQAVQGEIVGPGVCGNKYGLTEHRLYVFDVFSIAEQRYLLPGERTKWLCDAHAREPAHKWHHVPVRTVRTTPESVDAALAAAEFTSALADVPAEGLVFKSLTDGRSFKAISNEWLLKYKA